MGEQQCFLLLICRQGSTVGCRGRERVFVEKPNQLLVPPCQFGAAWAPHHLVESSVRPCRPSFAPPFQQSARFLSSRALFSHFLGVQGKNSFF